PVPYTFTLALRATKLPHLGPPLPVGAEAPLQFAGPVAVDDKVWATEPSIAVTPDGDEYVAALVGTPGGLYRSHAGGAFEAVDLPLAHCTGNLGVLPPVPPYPRATHVGCGDVDVATAGDKDVYFTYHWGDEGIAATHDGGATWLTQPLGTGPEIHTDRQWLATNGAMEAWMAYDGMATYLGGGSYVSHTLDGGLTWLNAGKVLGNTQCVTGLARAAAPKTTLYVAGCDDKGPGLAVSKDNGLTFDWHTIVAKPTPDFFVKVATDASGTVTAAWTEPDPAGGSRIVLARSADDGATWSAPEALPLPAGTYVYPWLTGGAAGHLAVAFYGTLDRGLGEATPASKFDAASFNGPEHVLGEWYALVALTEDGGSTWKLASVSDQPMQQGPICLGGNGCAHGRNLGDFFQVQADAKGLLHVAYVDSHLEPDREFGRMVVARQVGGATLGGPSVEKNGGAARSLLR
ncbi:MAG: glycoside hydrolase, partial [Halobacteriales archaeon]|nr:glycoside hydrolase [Halobacteriales archaeon]